MGIVDVPQKATHGILGLTPELISNEIFVEVRYGLRPLALADFHFDDVRDGMFRIFVIPDDESGEHRILAVAEEEALEGALAGADTREKERLIRFMHAAAAPPDRWATTIGLQLEDTDKTQPDMCDLFSHQVASVGWMKQAEIETIVQAKALDFGHQTFGNNYEVKLPAGGVLAHPPGAGKTRIVAAFIKSNP